MLDKKNQGAKRWLRADKKGYLEISFAWIFALIVGAFILFLAIYLSTKIINTEQTAVDAKTAKEIGILLNPLETGFETGKVTYMVLPSETRVYNRCDAEGFFGKQVIKVSQKIFNKWTDTDIDISFQNKYIFSESMEEGKKFNIFSKPFNFPFKVSDIIYITPSSKKYCFINSPSSIKDEISSLKPENILTENCEQNAIQVCFDGGACEINVNYGGKYVEKNGKFLYFEDDSLMYGAIFSDPETYECQLKRLMKRASNLALLYKDKSEFVSRVGCNSEIKSLLIDLSSQANSLQSSANLHSIAVISEEIKSENAVSPCIIW